jgi:hypothetical protein
VSLASESTTFVAITIFTMVNAEIDENRSPDELTSLLTSGNTLPWTPEPQTTEVAVQENAHSEGETTEPHTNQYDRSWAGLPLWLGWVALFALLLGCVASLTRITRCTSTEI